MIIKNDYNQYDSITLDYIKATFFTSMQYLLKMARNKAI